jgi:hypothetical protein
MVVLRIGILLNTCKYAARLGLTRPRPALRAVY